MPPYTEFIRLFGLDRGVVFLNHGSFGACPLAVLEAQSDIRERLEREPVRFFVDDLEGLLDSVRESLGRFMSADPEGFVRVGNATEGVNTVVRSLRLRPGDELLVNTHEYNACVNAMRFAADAAGARVVAVEVPWPLRDESQVIEAVLGGVTDRTRLVLLSHVTSPTGVIFPIGPIVEELSRRGVDALIDGAHAPGMIPLDLNALDAPYYTGNGHKWLCGPKGAGFLWVRKDRREGLRPLSISHGANSTRADRSRFRLEFDYTGTADMSAYLVLPEAIRFMGSLLPGGWPELMRRNRELALRMRGVLCAAMGTGPAAPEGMIGSLAAVRIADRRPGDELIPTRHHDSLQDRLVERWGVQVPIVPFPGAPSAQRWVRVSAQVYNTQEQAEYLAGALREELGAP